MKRKGETLLAHFQSYSWLMAGVWTACVAWSLLWNLNQQRCHVHEVARSSAEVTFENDVLYRHWVARQGGVYVRVSEHTPPNPYLDVPERDVTTTSGLALTLVNPSYLVRQVNEGATDGNRAHITSLRPIRPENAPDAWEAAALRAFERGVQEVSSIERMDQGEYLRLMRPYVVEESCLRCHGAQGYREGDIRGGISVSVPMAPLRAVGKPMMVDLALAHLCLWAVGMTGITISGRKLGEEILVREQAEADLRVHTEALRESEQRYRTLLEIAPDPIVVHRDGRFLYANDAALALMGARSFEQLAQHTVLDFAQPEDREPAVERMRMAAAGDRLPTREAVIPRLDAQKVAVEFHTTLVDFHGERAILTIIRDVTERKRAEEELRQALLVARQRCAEISALMDGTRAVLEHQDRVSSSRAVFDACRRLLGARAGYVAVLTADEQSNEVLFLEPGGLSCTVDPSLPMPIRGFRAEAYRTGRVLYDNDFANSGWARLLPPGHVRLENVLFAPMVVDGRTIGLLGLGNKPGGFADHDATLAGTFAELVAIALRNSRTLESLRELNATLESKVAERTAELEHRTRQLQKLALELSQAEDRERKRVAAVLHEDLQQQIAAAKFHLSLLNGRADQNPKYRAAVARVDEMLRDAIEKSRNLSHELSPAVLHRNDLVESLGWLAQQMQSKHGLTVHVDARGDTLLQSEALAVFLFRTAQEMLFNAIKHARVGEARLRVRCMGRYVCLSVSDRGRGFDPQALREMAGFGLLSIRERIELLGGRMKIRSAAGRGSTLLVVVPDGREPQDGGHKTEDGAVPQLPSSVFLRPSSAPRLRVLLVDDHDVVREGLAALLAEAGDIEVVGEVPDGREAIDQAVRLRPDVILMDVFMPLMNGDEAARQIRTHLPDTRIVAMSMLQEEAVERMRRAGVEAFVLKTAPTESLLAAIRGKSTYA